MEGERIKQNMSTLDAIMTLGEGNPGALTVLATIVKDSRFGDWQFEFITLDHYKIYGNKIWLLYKDCCNENFDVLSDTLRHIRHGIFATKDVKENLESEHPITFIDDSIIKQFARPYDQEVIASVLYSKLYQDAIRESFYKRKSETGMGSGGMGEGGQPTI